MTIDPTVDPLYGVEQVAEMFGVKPYTVRGWIEQEKLPGTTKIEGRWRIPKSAIIFLANKEHG